MSATIANSKSMTPAERRAEELFTAHRLQIYQRADRMFAVLMLIQWLASIAAALWISPRAWSGPTSQTHIHVWAAWLLGGLITAAPVLLAWRKPGATITRHVIAAAQMLTSALLIHLTGGRIETHFHVFGSLAFLAFYRDWTVLLTATVVVALDHFLRGLFLPESVYGILNASWWRSMEHAGWVVFEDVILVRWCFQGLREMREIATRTAELEITNANIEQTIIDRTAELRASEERNRQILALSNDPFIAINDEGRVVEWNDQAEEHFGWSRPEAVGQQLSSMIIPERFREPHAAGINKFLATGEGPILNQLIEISAVNRAGTEFPVEITISPIQLESGWLFSAFARDITARKQVETELQQAKEAAEAASQAKGDFLANMSHEIRTPLNGIVGMTELALDTPLSSGQREYLTTVKSCADSLLTVINDILDFSKIEAGKLQMDCVGFRLSEVIGDTCKTLGFRAHQKNLELACRTSPHAPEYLMGDPNRLRQVLVNLIGNAIKFTHQGEVVVQAEVESQNDRQAVVHFSVRDTGIGIPAAQQDRIFQAFEQADASTTRKFGGTGLGLAISQKIIHLMGGRIWVESQEGLGSTFHFTAVFELDHSAATTTESASKTILEDVRVLVVDDNATNRRILEEVLQKWRMKPTLVESGKEALAALETASARMMPFKLVLLDGQMPEMDGFALARKIKADPQITPVTLMMLSSGAHSADSKRCRELGVSAYLTKPLKQSELLDMILSLLCPAAANDRENFAALNAATLPMDDSRRLTILLAEDNPVNQRVAKGILEKHRHIVTAVTNGLEALEALKMQKFDLVLMDLQMPEMDGFAATAAIREQEKTSGKHLPIVAMTARAMKGDRECCLQAGMDGYISKPVNPKDLLACIHSVVESVALGATPSEISQPSKPAAKQTTPESKPSESKKPELASMETDAINLESLLERVENDTTLLEEMIQLYMESSPRLMDDIAAGVQRRDAAAIQRAAHTLKGALQNLSADPCAALAKQMETAGRLEDLNAAEQTLAELKRELERLQSALTNWAEGALV